MNDFRNPTGVQWNPGSGPHGGGSGVATFGSDDNLLVMFYNRSVENAQKSIDAGRRIFENKVYVKIQHPGETHNIIDRPIAEEDKNRFRRHWNLFLQNRLQVPEGTPIDLLFPNHPAMAENLRSYGVYTVEQCAKLSAHAIDGIGRGAQECVNKAQKYLDSSDKGRSFHLMQRELDQAKQQIKIQEQTIGKLKSALDDINTRISNPVGGTLSPPFISGYDAQTERINANHPTSEIATNKRKRRKSSSVSIMQSPSVSSVDVPDAILDPFAQSENPSQP